MEFRPYNQYKWNRQRSLFLLRLATVAGERAFRSPVMKRLKNFPMPRELEPCDQFILGIILVSALAAALLIMRAIFI